MNVEPLVLSLWALLAFSLLRWHCNWGSSNVASQLIGFKKMQKRDLLFQCFLFKREEPPFHALPSRRMHVSLVKVGYVPTPKAVIGDRSVSHPSGLATLELAQQWSEAHFPKSGKKEKLGLAIKEEQRQGWCIWAISKMTTFWFMLPNRQVNKQNTVFNPKQSSLQVFPWPEPAVLLRHLNNANLCPVIAAPHNPASPCHSSLVSH